MDRVSERNPEPVVADVLGWAVHEFDAAWTAKLVVLRVDKLDDIHHFGECLREHERHAGELLELVTDRIHKDLSREPRFLTREPHVIGAAVDRDVVLDAREGIERERIARYRSQRTLLDSPCYRALHRLPERHECDACARLNWLRGRLGRCESHQAVAE